MRATKAYLAGIGTTGVLLAAAIMLLVLMSAMVGFDAWPGSRSAERVERLDLGPEDPIAVATEDVVAAAAAPAGAAAAPAAAGDPVPVVTAPPAAAPEGGSPQVLGDRESGGSPPAAVPPPGGSQPSVQVTPPPLTFDGVDPNDPESTRRVVADTAQNVARELGRGVGALDPGLGDSVTRTGDALSDQLRALPLPLNLLGD